MELGNSTTTVVINGLMALAGFLVCYNIIPKFRDMFINAHLFGIDLSKRSKEKV
jgi:UDP-N-acetylglucosamine--dolichyl-phosphate N-acetylglucosaminephosphotransferase